MLSYLGRTPRPGRGRRRVAPPAVGLDQRGQHPQRGGLARAVGPEEAEDLALVDIEVDAVDGADLRLGPALLRSGRSAPDLAPGSRRLLSWSSGLVAESARWHAQFRPCHTVRTHRLDEAAHHATESRALERPSQRAHVPGDPGGQDQVTRSAGATPPEAPCGSRAAGRARRRRRSAPSRRRPAARGVVCRVVTAGRGPMSTSHQSARSSGRTTSRASSSQRSRDRGRVRNPPSSSSMPSPASTGSTQTSRGRGARPRDAASASTAWIVVSWHCRRAQKPRAGGASFRKTRAARSSEAAVIDRASSPLPRSATPTGPRRPCRPPRSRDLLVGRLLASHESARPAVHHPLVRDEVEHRPVRAVGTGASSPARPAYATNAVTARAARRDDGRWSGRSARGGVWPALAATGDRFLCGVWQ